MEAGVEAGKRFAYGSCFVDLTSAGAQRVFGIAGKGRMAEGWDADLTIVDLKARRTLSHAAMAHSVAKLQVGNCFITFDPAMDRRLVERRNLELELRQAMARNELAVHYQPQVSMKTGAPVAAEALLRWQHADKGYISPATFIPLAEETGFIVELGRWVLRTACQEAAIWPAHIRLAVNFSPVQFELTDVVSEVRLALTQSGLAPERLDVEITEGIFLAGSSRIEVMLQGLRALGVGIALDDFGTGFSSLGYISRLPIDKIKIDQSFVRKLPDDTQTVAVISAILALSQSLDRAIVVEGVESEQQAELLRSMGCDIAQGFHFARPMSAPDVRSFLLPPERRNILRLIG